MQPCNPSNPRRELRRPFLRAFCLAGALVSTGCASLPQRPEIAVPETFRKVCSGPVTEGVATVGDLAAFSIRQEAALQVCEGKRAGALAILDAANQRANPKRKLWPW